MTQKKGNWRDLCEAAARETDSEKLLELAEKLIKALDEESAVEEATQVAGSKRSTPSASTG